MQVSHDVTVDRIELREAILTVLRGRRRHYGQIILAPLASGLAVQSESAEVRIKAVGVWGPPIKADGAMLKKLAPKFPRTKELQLAYLAGRLHLGPTAIPAAPTGSMF